MKGWNFILSIIKQIEHLFPGIIAYGYEDGNLPQTHKWWTVCISDYEIYMSNPRFKALSRAWRKAAIARGYKVVFCYCKPLEEILAKLAKNDNLILNLEEN